MVDDLTTRARRLLIGGFVGAHVVAVLCVVGFLVGGGTGPGVTAAITAAIVIVFFAIGQGVQIIVADRPPKVVLVAALTSYTIRVTVLGWVLWLVVAQRARYAWIDAPAAIITTVLVVHGWLLAEFWVYRKLRIPVYDTPYSPPK